MKINILLIILVLFSFTPDKNQDFYNFCQKNGKSISPTYQTRNCVQFMDKVLKDYLHIDNKELTKIIYIKYDIKTVEKSIKNKDTSIIGGVSYGLVKFNYANYVKLKDIKKGDIVQYWSTVGFTNGHCGIFEGYDKFGNILLIGSHQDSKGFGVMNTYSKNFNIHFYICRLK